MDKQYERIINVLGEDDLKKMRKSSVMVIGLGGVGSYAAEGLARSGVGRLGLVDRDVLEYSNLNRQIEALHSTIGREKSIVMAERIRDINPETETVSYQLSVNANSLDELFEFNPDYIVDAIDDMNAKIELWKRCQQKQIPFVASLGMARRMDPTKVTQTTLNRTTDDPMARKLRYLAKQAGLDLNIKVIWSSETPLPSQQEGILGSMIFVPATAGLVCAKTCIYDLLGK